MVEISAQFFHPVCNQCIEQTLPADMDFSSLSKFKRILASMDFSDYQLPSLFLG